MLRYIKRIWTTRGSGFYAATAAATFLYLETSALGDAFHRAGGAGAWLEEAAFASFLSLGMETVPHAVVATVWPVVWVEELGASTAAAFAMVAWLAWRSAARIVAWRGSWAGPGRAASPNS